MIFESKRCTKCHRELPATTEHFYVLSASLDGLDDRCKACWRARRAEMRRELRQQMRGGLGPKA